MNFCLYSDAQVSEECSKKGIRYTLQQMKIGDLDSYVSRN
jgi:hypothetical protein